MSISTRCPLGAETDDVLQETFQVRWSARYAASNDTITHDAPSLATLQIRRELIDLSRHYYGPEGIGANHDSKAKNMAEIDLGRRGSRISSCEAELPWPSGPVRCMSRSARSRRRNAKSSGCCFTRGCRRRRRPRCCSLRYERCNSRCTSPARRLLLRFHRVWNRHETEQRRRKGKEAVRGSLPLVTLAASPARLNL